MTSTSEVTLEGLANFRDLGGLGTTDGARIRRGIVFRSDSLHRLTERDASRLVEIGIVAAIDFRAADELERFGLGTLSSTCIRHVHVPTFDVGFNDANVDELINRPVVDFYLNMLEVGAPSFGAAARTLADAESLPAVFFCFAGKDRTGIFAAFVLGLLGVSDADVVADYARSHAAAARRKAMLLEERPEAVEIYKRIPPALAGALPETMEGLIAGVEARYGGWQGYAAAIGFEPQAIAALRANLLEEPGSA